MTNSEDPSQTAPQSSSLIWVISVLSVLYLLLLRFFSADNILNIMQTIPREKSFDMVSEG